MTVLPNDYEAIADFISARARAKPPSGSGSAKKARTEVGA